MTAVQESKIRFYKERAAQLAIVYLTRRDDLRVQNPLPDMGIDLFVSLLKNEKATGRFWGVVARGVATEAAAEKEQSGVLGENALLRDAPFPICEFVFAMDTDAGFWRWLREPAEGETTRLVWSGHKNLRTLDNAAIESICQTAHLWYEQRK